MAAETSRVIGDQGIWVTPTGYRIDIRLPWYRSLPVSTVEVGEVAIDGKTVDPTDCLFELEGKAFPLAAMAEQTEHVWYVLDSAYLNIAAAGAVRGPHAVTVTLNLYPPYIRGLKRMTRDVKTLNAN